MWVNAEDNEYTKQLILSCLESITQHIYVDLHPKAQQDAMDVEQHAAAISKKARTIEKQYQGAPETIVQCIRGTFFQAFLNFLYYSIILYNLEAKKIDDVSDFDCPGSEGSDSLRPLPTNL